MKPRLQLLALATLLFLLRAVAPPARAEPPPAPSFTGQWRTTYGTMALTQEGDRVTGTYTSEGAPCTLSGRVAEGRLTFSYQEPSTKGEGWFDLAADGRSFKGQWRPAGEVAWQSWSGRRVRERAVEAKGFDGAWNTSWGMMRLVQDGNRVHGIYAGEGGSRLAGELKGGRLTFEYQEPEAKGAGWFELAADGDHFHGGWTPAGGAQESAWDGARVTPRPGRQWLVVLEARWEESLAEREYAFGDMLRPFFARLPNVEVRHRYFTDEHSLAKWCSEVAYLVEPVVLLIATHGTPEGIEVGGHTIGARSIVQSLRYARSVQLLHFSSCLAMKDRMAVEILRGLGKDAAFPISGYTTEVDWSASAILELMYLDLQFAHEMTPEEAAGQLAQLLPFSGAKRVPGAPFESAGFRIIRPEEVK